MEFMNKNKREVLILLVLIFLGINYAVYEYLIYPKYTEFKAQKAKYNEKKQSVVVLEGKKDSIEGLKVQVSKLKEESKALDDIAPYYIDTPQLVYDFYMYCSKYNVKGDNISFQLSESNNSKEENSSLKSLAIVSKLSINLKVNGSNNSIEEFIKNLDKITSRKLNVVSVTLTDKDGTASEQIEAEIVFNQYLQGSGKLYNKDKTYSTFYSETEDFKTIADMFKK